jgi:hypothetical protein
VAKDQLSLERHRVRALRGITIHASFCMTPLLLNDLTTLRMNRSEKARFVTFLTR